MYRPNNKPRSTKIIIEKKKITEEATTTISEINLQIKKLQSECKKHIYKDIRGFDPNYQSHLDQQPGEEVLESRICRKCSFFVSLKNTLTTEICRKCGGKMKHDHWEHFGDMRVHIHECQKCGHEYDTT